MNQRSGAEHRPRQAAEFHLFGIPEAEAGKQISRLELPETVIVGYRPHFPEIEVRLSATDGEPQFETAVAQVRALLGDRLVSEEPKGNLVRTVHELLLSQQRTIAVAESCTGGYLGKLLSDLPGSSSYFLGGVLSYRNEVKEQLLEVPAELLEQHGAVSAEVAEAMAVGVLKRTGAELALSITGIAGPDGGTEAKPVGLFYVGIASLGFEAAIEFFYAAERDFVRRYAAFAALDSLRRFLLGLPFLGKVCGPLSNKAP